MACSRNEPGGLAPDPWPETMADHDTGSSIGGVQDAADGVVQRGLGVEAVRGSICEPADESIH